MPELAYVNGTIGPIEEAKVSIEDRGYQFADAVYEVVVSYNGKPFLLNEHMVRLKRSMAGLKFPPVDLTALEKEMRNLFDISEIDNAALYLQISRGAAPRNHAYDNQMAPQIIMTIRPATALPAETRISGYTVITVPDTRWGRCDLKTVQLSSNGMAKQQALDSGADDAIFVGDDGVLREGTSSNLFMVINNKIITHPADERILPGITRQAVIALCEELNLPVRLEKIPQSELANMEELFLTGTVTEVLSVVNVNGKPIGDGKPGPVAEKLQQAYVAMSGRPNIS